MSHFTFAEDPATGHRLRYHRRRYGRKTFTWIEVAFYPDGAEEPLWLSLGDPWPCLRPALAEVRRDAAAALLRNAHLQETGGAR